jgi:hypothetical protein
LSLFIPLLICVEALFWRLLLVTALVDTTCCMASWLDKGVLFLGLRLWGIYWRRRVWCWYFLLIRATMDDGALDPWCIWKAYMAVGVYIEGRTNLNRIRESVQRANINHTKPNHLSHYLGRHLTLCKQIIPVATRKISTTTEHDNRTDTTIHSLSC